MRNRTRGFIATAGLVASCLTGVATATSADACTINVIDIGSTVYSAGWVKGSGSYTSGTCTHLKKVTIYIQSRVKGAATWHELNPTEVVRYPSNAGGSSPNVLEFSAKDWASAPTSDLYEFSTKILAVDGAGNNLTPKTSNIITLSRK